jgi:hypothetical protein
MKSTGFTFWRDGDMWPGCLDDYPDYTTQGASLVDFDEHLLDLHREHSSGAIPGARQLRQLKVA